MRYLTLGEILTLYEQVMRQSGGMVGIRNIGALEAAAMQPRATFDGCDLYPSLVEKASALAFSLIQNHPFVDGNKRIGHAAMEVFLIVNGYEIQDGIDEQEQLILAVASGSLTREQLAAWLQTTVRPHPTM